MNKFLGILIITILTLNSCLFGQEFKIINGSDITKCGDSRLVLKATNDENTTGHKWFLKNFNIPFSLSDSLVLEDSYSAPFVKDFIVEAIQNGKKVSTEVRIKYLPKPQINLIDEISFCEGDSAVISDLLVAETGTRYSWSNNLGTTSTITVKQSGSYILTKMKPLPNDCFVKDTVKVIVHKRPQVTISSSQPTCAAGTISLKTTLNISENNTKYTWEPKELFNSTSQNSQNIEYEGTKYFNQKIFVSVIDSLHQCSGNTDSLLIKVFPPVDISISNKNISLCDQDSITVTLENSHPEYLIEWFQNNSLTENRSNTFVSKISENIKVIVTDTISKCKDEDQAVTEFRYSPSGFVFEGLKDTLPNNEHLDIKLVGTTQDEPLNWHIDSFNGEYSIDNQILSISPTLQDIGEINISVSAKNSCGGDSVNTKIIFKDTKAPLKYSLYIPNSFQPSNTNPEVSHFKIYGENISKEDFSLMVFNEWGKVIYETTSFTEAINNGWDGENFPTEKFSYLLKAKYTSGENIDKQGTILLIR